MEFKDMTIDELEARRLAIGEEVEKEGADLDSLEAEIKGIPFALPMAVSMMLDACKKKGEA